MITTVHLYRTASDTPTFWGSWSTEILRGINNDGKTQEIGSSLSTLENKTDKMRARIKYQHLAYSPGSRPSDLIISLPGSTQEETQTSDNSVRHTFKSCIKK